ncbi:hypothetical protein [Streptomyces albidoflavus]|uniref:hypothetical protein n=1 Tax=Streptomyces albidoflavus TaxID=1886 RepID=UPI0033C03B24
MAEESNADSRKVTDRDLAQLIKRGLDDMANDPAAAELLERMERRANIDEDREHRERSEKVAMAGSFLGLALLIAVIVSIVYTLKS